MKALFKINKKAYELEFAPNAKLLDVLRDNGFTEVKCGCREGFCGACSILLDGELVNSCMVYAASVGDREITTVKGIGSIHEPHPIQEAFVEAGAVQCGFWHPRYGACHLHPPSKKPRPER